MCAALRVRENPGNWSAYPNVDGEARGHLDDCEWYEVYDIIETTYAALLRALRSGSRLGDEQLRPDYFAQEINNVFRKEGIGWQFVDGQVQVRGPEAFEDTIKKAYVSLAESGRATAANEIHHALLDLSRRPEADLTGALQHGLAALECVMRDVCGDPKATLGVLLSGYKGFIPPPLDQAVEKIWGYASEQGRHIQEGRGPTTEEAELAVHVAAAVVVYLSKKRGT